MIAYDPGQPLISIHIPKTAGTSFRLVLKQWFGDRLYLHYPEWSRLGDAPWEPGVCIHGHFNRALGLGVDDCYPKTVQRITLTRDPFDRLVSLWRHLERNREPSLDGVASFGAWFEKRVDDTRADPTAGFLRNFFGSVSAQTVTGMFDDGFVGVGVTHRLQDSVDLLAHALGKPTIEVGVENVAPAGDADFSGWRARHEDVFALEHAVHAEAIRVFERDLASVRGG